MPDTYPCQPTRPPSPAAPPTPGRRQGRTAGTARPRFAVPRSSTRPRPWPPSGAEAEGIPIPRPTWYAASAIGLGRILGGLLDLVPVHGRETPICAYAAIDS